MSRIYSHINTAKTILNNYKGEVPLSVFLKNYFAKEKKYGSRDRRSISSLCYNYYRIGSACAGEDISRKFLTSTFLCNGESNEFVQLEKPEWNEKIDLPLERKIELTGIKVEEIFQFNQHLSTNISIASFNKSFLIQPDLFIRVRPGKKDIVRNKLLAAQVPFREINEMCLAFANGTKLEQVLDINAEVVIQDYNSQQVGEYFPGFEKGKINSVWDCCAASGGKSIMALDLLKQVELTVSDVRQSIIHNLQNRFKDAGIRNYRSFVADVTNSKSLQPVLSNARFDLVICDAPCSGSGTWSRTPEQLLHFKEEEINRYSNLQKQIASNAVRYLRKGGHLLYITCSVFEEENEEVVEFLQNQASVDLEKQELLKGFDIKADSMYVALFKAN